MSDKNSRKPRSEPADSSLPRFGFADDLIGKSASADEHQAPAGADRIFAFADTIDHQQGSIEAREEALETWVTFTLGHESFGLPVTHVQEILRVATVTRVPHAPNPIRGVTNMRGRVLPVVDLRLRLGLPMKEIDVSSRILVVESRSRLIGLLVDSVQQVLRLARSAIQPPPPDVMTAQSDYILGVYHLQESLVILLEVDRVLIIKETANVAETVSLRG